MPKGRWAAVLPRMTAVAGVACGVLLIGNVQAWAGTTNGEHVKVFTQADEVIFIGTNYLGQHVQRGPFKAQPQVSSWAAWDSQEWYKGNLQINYYNYEGGRSTYIGTSYCYIPTSSPTVYWDCYPDGSGHHD